MTIEEAIEYWQGLRKTFSSQLEKEENHFGRMHLQTTIDALDMSISALMQQEHFRDLTKKVEPLTLDELRQMDGEPVYCVEITGREEWLFRRDGGFADMYGEFTSDDFMVWDNYGKLWWCYRQKPEEGTV